MNTKAQKIKEFLVMTAGVILLTIGVYFFKIPNGFSTGGVTGIGTILGAMTPITSGIWIWILNIGLLLVGFLFLGRSTGLKTVYCSMAYSALIYFFEAFVPLKSPLSDQPLLELFYAMLLTSIGSAMIFNSGASSGGTDIAALILKKYVKIDVGKALLCVDFVVAASAFFVFGVKRVFSRCSGFLPKPLSLTALSKALTPANISSSLPKSRRKSRNISLQACITALPQARSSVNTPTRSAQ